MREDISVCTQDQKGAREMVHWLSTAAALSKGEGSVPGIHMNVNNCLQPQFHRTLHPLRTSEGIRSTCGMQAGKIYIKK